jgi:Ca2+-binding EF-hand superfamily protein
MDKNKMLQVENLKECFKALDKKNKGLLEIKDIKKALE